MNERRIPTLKANGNKWTCTCYRQHQNVFLSIWSPNAQFHNFNLNLGKTYRWHIHILQTPMLYACACACAESQLHNHYSTSISERTSNILKDHRLLSLGFLLLPFLTSSRKLSLNEKRDVTINNIEYFRPKKAPTSEPSSKSLNS